MRRVGNILAVIVLYTLVLTACNTGLSQTANVDYLVLKFESNRSKVQVGEPVQMRFTITNTGKQPRVIESQNTPVMDIRVAGDGTLDWSEQNPNQISHHLEWQPGESKVIEWSWTPKQGDVYSGAFHDIGLIGILSSSSAAQATSVRVCASDVCR